MIITRRLLAGVPRYKVDIRAESQLRAGIGIGAGPEDRTPPTPPGMRVRTGRESFHSFGPSPRGYYGLC